jgi:hypothetical protein
MNGTLGKSCTVKLNTSFYVQYALTAFEITKGQEANAEKCLAIRNFPNLFSFVLIQNMKSQHFGNAEHDSSSLKR